MVRNKYNLYYKMSEFMDFSYRMTGIRENPLEYDEGMIEGELQTLKDMRKAGKLNMLGSLTQTKTTVYGGSQRVIPSGAYITGRRGDKTFEGLMMSDTRNQFGGHKTKGKAPNLKVAMLSKTDPSGMRLHDVKRKEITGFTRPSSYRKQRKPEKNKKTAPQKVARSELKTGGALAKAKAREELKTGKTARKGRVSLVDVDGEVYRDEIDKVYLKRNIRA